MGKIIKLTENQFSEMMAYHGSGSDFDKFNHKKYLSKGAGSQVFGWGTYITNDVAIANGYAEDSKEKYDVWPYIYNGLIRNGVRKKDAIQMSNLKVKLEQIITGLGNNKECVITYLKNTIEYYKEINETKPLIEFKAMLYAMNQIKRKTAYLYEVDIPEDDGFNYLSWYDYLTDEQVDTIYSGMMALEKKYGVSLFDDIYDSDLLVDGADGEALYCAIASCFYKHLESTNSNSKPSKAASLFLMQCGFDGIKYEAGTVWGKPYDASEDAYNYVIFDANKVKIVNKTKV